MIKKSHAWLVKRHTTVSGYCQGHSGEFGIALLEPHCQADFYDVAHDDDEDDDEDDPECSLLTAQQVAIFLLAALVAGRLHS
jgi:hypothetical protein